MVERRVLVVQIAKDEAPERITRKIHHLHGWLVSHPGRRPVLLFNFLPREGGREYVFHMKACKSATSAGHLEWISGEGQFLHSQRKV